MKNLPTLSLEAALKENFGFDHFRSGQKQIIEQLLEGKDTLGILPTGAGKSICYQLPALLLDGLTIVISPLISLMKDQVDQLEAAGIAATYLNSTVNEAEAHFRMSQIKAGNIKLLFVAPERFELESFSAFMSQLPISLVAIDEAHCISQWGHDFRPSYLAFAQRLEQLQPKPRILALTATATLQVERDIEQLLDLKSANTVKTGFLRENLRFEVVKNSDKRNWLRKYLDRRDSSDTGIIYCSTRKEVEELSDFLNHLGYKARRYHAGLTEAERAQNQEDFLYDNCQLMVATNAFGMGINKSNVRYVIHYSTPSNIEAYYQEAGRAGRDGLASEAVLLWSLNDLRIRNFLIEQGDGDEAHKDLEYEKLRQMQAYANSESCLQRFILRYFGDEGEDCGKCSNCQDTRILTDITIPSQKVLSCVVRMGEHFGKAAITGVLSGSKNKKLAQWNFEQLSTFGIMKDLNQRAISNLIDFLTSEGYLNVSSGKFPLLSVSNAGKMVLKGQAKVERRETMVIAKPKMDVPDDFDLALFEALKGLRLQLAHLLKLPPFMIFSDASLQDMTHLKPLTDDEFLQVSGVGPQKLEKYGPNFLKVIRSFN